MAQTGEIIQDGKHLERIMLQRICIAKTQVTDILAT